MISVQGLRGILVGEGMDPGLTKAGRMIGNAIAVLMIQPRNSIPTLTSFLPASTIRPELEDTLRKEKSILAGPPFQRTSPEQLSLQRSLALLRVAATARRVYSEPSLRNERSGFLSLPIKHISLCC